MVLAFFWSVPDLIVSHFNYILSDYYALTALAAAIATAKAVKTLRLKHSQSHLEDNQSEQFAYEFDFLAMTSIAQF